MHYRFHLILLAALALCSSPAYQTLCRADAPAATATAPAVDAEIVQYINAGTIAVARADASKLDLDAIQTMMTTDAIKTVNSTQPAGAPMVTRLETDDAKNLANMRRVADQFKATGATKIYALMAAHGTSSKGIAVMVIVPTGPGVDAKAVSNLLLTGHSEGGDPINPGQTTRIMNRSVLYGTDEDLDFITQTQPDERTDIAAGLAVGKDAGFSAVVAIPSALRLTFGFMIGATLPQELGGGSTMTVTQGFTWGAITMNSPADGSAHLVIQCGSPEAAAAIQKAAIAGINTLKTDKIPKQLPNTGADVSKVLDEIAPTIDGSQLKSELKGDAYNDAWLTLCKAAAESQAHPAQ
jgi:hypothetical protein